MSYEKNCAVAEKLGLEIYTGFKPENGAVAVSADVGYESSGPPFAIFNYCNDPRDYMKLVKNNRMSILFTIKDSVFCVAHDQFGKRVESNKRTDNEIGLAVVDAFLQI